LLNLLQQAHDSKGPYRPVLTVGRDGIFVRLRKDTKYREAATATVTLLDRRGRRLGTVYVGQMPEPGQGTLSQQLTALLTAVLEHPGPLPRLQYVTDVFETYVNRSSQAEGRTKDTADTNSFEMAA
jgi:hypothetical protein